MYTYTLQSERQVIDYYTDDRKSYPESDWTFSDASVWAARLRLILHLIKKQKDSTIVDFSEISVSLSVKGEEESVFLGAWRLISSYYREYFFNWNWQSEADFLEKHNLYRAGDKELLAIEQAYHQSPQRKKDPEVIANLRNELNDFTKKYADSLQLQSPEIGLLYYFLDDEVQACEYFIRCPMSCLKDLAYNLVESLFWYDKDIYRQYLKIYDEVYKGYRPPFLL